jgi:hypothetical protein
VSTRTRAWLAPALKAIVSLALLAVLFARVDVSRLWSVARTASLPWLVLALGLYLLMIVVSAWRWGLLLRAQGVHISNNRLTSSFLVATFFNNFLPSNIGGDVIRVADTAPAAGSKTLAATIVLIDRGIGLLGLVLIAALGASVAAQIRPDNVGVGAGALWAGFGLAAMVATPALFMPEGFMRLLQPLRVIHPEWVDQRLGRMTTALARFRGTPIAIAGCFAGAVLVQAVIVVFYAAIVRSMKIPIGLAELAVIIPISLVVQMLPISMNGFGVREATIGFYFTRLGLPLESGLLVSFVGAALIMLFSLSGGLAYVMRGASGRVTSGSA